MIEHTADFQTTRSSVREHLSGYQLRDFEIVDYQMFDLPGTRLSFRGPAPSTLDSGAYFTCVGAAQTLGCFCEHPYATLIAEKIGLPALNLGYGGAGPEFFERHESLDKFINGGRFLILQIMSGRSQSNSIFECRGLELLTRRIDGAKLSSNLGYSDLLYGVPSFQPGRFLQRLSRRVFPRLIVPKLLAKPRIRRVIEETRRGWVESYQRFLSRINVPVLLLWFSKRQPHYQESFADIGGLFGEFPQLVNREMVESVRRLCDQYVECISDRGSPQLLVSRFTGKPAAVDPAQDRADFAGDLWTHNRYYPTPEMHEDAAQALLAPVKILLQKPGKE
jgi:hypothetical protein